MNLNELLRDLKQAHEDFENIKHEQKPIEARMIESEIPLVMKFAEKLAPFAKKRKISGEDAVLLYVYESSGKTLISPEIYLKKNGEIAYEVYDEQGYRRFRPTAIIEDGYNLITLREFLHNCPFHEIVSFYRDRVDVLYEDAETLVNNNKIRQAFINEMKKVLKD